MKTLIKHSFFVLVATLGMTSLRAQTADDIVNKYVTAIGGKDLVKSIKSVVIDATVDAMGTQAPSTTTILNGKGYKSETDFNGSKIVQCITPAGGWMINPMVGQTTATAIPADQAKASASQLNIGGPLLDYGAKGGKLELIGKDTADYKLRLTTPDITVTYYINMKTYLIDKQVSSSSVQGQTVETALTFSDYRKTDFGYTVAYAEHLQLPQFELGITIKKVTVNAPVDPTIFDMPK